MAERECIFVGSIYYGKSDKFQDGVYGDNGKLCRTLLARSDNALILGYIDGGTGTHQSNVVYSNKGLAPTINCCGGGNLEPKVLIGSGKGDDLIEM